MRQPSGYSCLGFTLHSPFVYSTELEIRFGIIPSCFNSLSPVISHTKVLFHTASHKPGQLACRRCSRLDHYLSQLAISFSALFLLIENNIIGFMNGYALRIHWRFVDRLNSLNNMDGKGNICWKNLHIVFFLNTCCNFC